jgi:hypothetical protein
MPLDVQVQLQRTAVFLCVLCSCQCWCQSLVSHREMCLRSQGKVRQLQLVVNIRISVCRRTDLCHTCAIAPIPGLWRCCDRRRRHRSWWRRRRRRCRRQRWRRRQRTCVVVHWSSAVARGWLTMPLSCAHRGTMQRHESAALPPRPSLELCWIRRVQLHGTACVDIFEAHHFKAPARTHEAPCAQARLPNTPNLQLNTH